MMSTSYTFQGLLSSLESREARKLAALSSQVKVEQFLLAEMAFAGSEQFADLDFYLEEKRRDLTIRMRQQGSLVDWVEAKMCYTDCLARRLTGRGNPEEYRNLLHRDAEKQRRDTLPAADRGTLFTLLLFAIHNDEPVPRHKYYPDFRNRAGNDAGKIEKAAQEYVHSEIVPFIKRDLVEEFRITLDPSCRLYVFAFRSVNGQAA